MSITRRSFIKNTTLIAFGAVITKKAGSLVFGQTRNPKPSGNFPIPASAQTNILYYSSYDMFAPYVNSIFTATGARGELVQLTLTAVTRYVPNANTRISTATAPTTQTCSLMFSASGKLPSFSGIPTLDHPALGKLQMFLVYHGEGDRGYLYEAVINHLDGVSLDPIDQRPNPKKKPERPSVKPPTAKPFVAPPNSRPVAQPSPSRSPISGRIKSQ